MPAARPGFAFLAILLLASPGFTQEEPKPIKDGEPLAGTKPLTLQGDIAAQLVAGVDRFLLKETEAAAKGREKLWARNTEDLEAFQKSIEPNRKRLAHILGVRNRAFRSRSRSWLRHWTSRPWWARGPITKCSPCAGRPLAMSTAKGCCCVRPSAGRSRDMIAIPDADVTPEQLCGLMPGVEQNAQYARRLAEEAVSRAGARC